MNPISSLLIALAAAVPVASPQVSMTQHFGDNSGGTLDKPNVEWSNDVLKVSATAMAMATQKVSDEAPGITVSGNTLTLCYHQKNTPTPPGQMTPHWAAPVRLDFTVRGLPKQDYTVAVTACS